MHKPTLADNQEGQRDYSRRMSKKKTRIVKPSKTALKLDLSYGELPKDHPYTRPAGFDPLRFPWPFKDGSVESAWSAFLFHRVQNSLRGKFMDELHRVLISRGTCTMLVPYWTSARAIWDPTAEWPPLCEQSFLYFGKKFREDNKMLLDWTCDFDFSYGYALEPETATKADDVRGHWVKHFANAINDLHVVLTKKA